MGRPPTSDVLPPALVALAFVYLFGPYASAPVIADTSEDQPLSIALVDATPDRSGSPFEKLRKIVAKSSDIVHVEGNKLLDSSSDSTLRRRMLRTPDRIDSNRRAIERALRRTDAEALLIYRHGDPPRLVGLGPSGDPVVRLDVPADDGTLEDGPAVDMLETALRQLAPNIRTFRRNRRREESAPDGAAEPTETSSDADNRSLDAHLSVALGPAAGRRSLSMSNSNGDIVLQHRTPYAGGSTRITAIPGLLAPTSLALEASGSFQYGRFRTRVTGTGQVRRGTISQGRGSIRLLGALSERFVLFGELGGQWFDIGLESNPRYVGSSYLAGLAGGGVAYHVGGLGTLQIAVDALPTVRTSTNDGRFGGATVSIGASTRAHFTLVAFDPAYLDARYRVDLYRPRYPNPRRYSRPVSGLDFMHLFAVEAGYRF